MPEDWHRVALTPDCNPAAEEGQILLAPNAPGSAGRLVVHRPDKDRVVKGGTHSEEYTAACARPGLIASLAEGDPPTIEYRAARLGDRLRLERSFQLELAIAVLTFIAAVGTGIATIAKARGDDDPSLPLSVVTFFAVVAFIAALLKFIQSLREA